MSIKYYFGSAQAAEIDRIGSIFSNLSTITLTVTLRNTNAFNA